MSENIILKNDPRMEFQLHDNGFNLIEGQADLNPGFYSYKDIRSVELSMLWYPKMVKYLRFTTWLINGAPLVGEISKKAKLVLNIRNTRLTIWLTDLDMVEKAKQLVKLLNKKK